MKPEDRLQEARKQLRIAAEDEDVSEIQSDGLAGLVAIVNAMEDSMRVQRDGELMTDGSGQTPLDRIFVEDDDDRPDEIVVDELTTLDADEFVARLESLANAAEAVETIAADLQRLRQTGLTEDDARDLIFGRNHELGKGDIETMFEAIDALVDGRTKKDPTERLLSDVSGLTLKETSELMDELDRLNSRYGGIDE